MLSSHDNQSVPALLSRSERLGRTRPNDYRDFVRVLIIITAAVTIVVLLGWIFSIEAMKRIAPGLTSMNPVTALGFGGSCLALWLVKDGRRTGLGAGAATLLSLGVLYVGVSKLVDLATGSALCPDALLFAAQLDYGQAYPSRIAPNVAGCFVLLALALLMVDRSWWPRLLHPQSLVTPILFVALAAIIGYAYDASGFYKVKQYIPMALHSAVCFVLMASAAILSRPDQGFEAGVLEEAPVPAAMPFCCRPVS